MATKATLAALEKLNSLREATLARTARKDFADDPARFKQFSVTLDDLLFDYSKQRIDGAVLSALVELAKACGVEAKRAAMFAGEKINITEKRAVLHTALRNFSGKPVLVEGPAGVGKTELAKALSRFLERRLVRLQCYEGLDEAKALYEWNYRKQLLRIQAEADGAGWDAVQENIFGEEFLL